MILYINIRLLAWEEYQIKPPPLYLSDIAYQNHVADLRASHESKLVAVA